jgi:serine/threonine protein kinase
MSVDELERKVQAQITAIIKAKEAEEERTHVQAEVGERVGADRDYPQGRYVIRKMIGKGVYGKVFECEDTKYGGAPVAVKIVRNEPLYRQAAVNEIKILSTLGGRCGILRICRDFTHLNHVCLSCDLYGESLTDKLRRNGAFSAEQVADVGIQLLHAINHMHACGIVHTDIKTENVLVHYGVDPSDQDGTAHPLAVRIVDLGSAIFENDWHQPLIGTNEYRAPEAILQLGWSYQVDIWGAGCILAEVTMGSKPFGEQLLDNVHLLLMEEYLQRPFPEAMLNQAWAKGPAKASKLLVQQEGAGKKVWINRNMGDILQERKYREAKQMRKEVTDPVLNDLLQKLLVFEAAGRSTAAAMRSHPFFRKCRFDIRSLGRLRNLLGGGCGMCVHDRY